MQFSWILPISSSMATTAPSPSPVMAFSLTICDTAFALQNWRIWHHRSEETFLRQKQTDTKHPTKTKDPRIETIWDEYLYNHPNLFFSSGALFSCFALSFTTCWAFSSITWVFPRWRYCWDRLSSNNKVCQSQNTRLSSIPKARHPHCHWQEPQEWTLPRLVSLGSGYPEAPQCFAGEKLPKSMRTTFFVSPLCLPLEIN